MKKYYTLIVLLAFCATPILAQEVIKKENVIKVKLKDEKEPLVLIDGKEYDTKIVELLDTDKIESITVLKDEAARKKYNAPDGVIIIKTKKSEDNLESKDEDQYPMVILDGKVSSREEVAKLDPNQIDAIEVVKGEKAKEKYKAANGVIIIKTKKKKN